MNVVKKFLFVLGIASTTISLNAAQIQSKLLDGDQKRPKNLLSSFSGVQEKKRLLIICDTLDSLEAPEIGGTELVLSKIGKELISNKYDFIVECMDLPYPSYPRTKIARPEICWRNGLDSAHQRAVAQKISTFKPDYILIALHGIMSYQAACYCTDNKIPFTAFCSTRHPQFIDENIPVPAYPVVGSSVKWFKSKFVKTATAYENSFLKRGASVLVPSLSFKKELEDREVKNIAVWPHGVDLEFFTLPSVQEKIQARKRCDLQGRKGPFYLYVTRLTREKNVQGFLDLKITSGTKILVGPDGTYKAQDLRKEYSDIIIPGMKQGKELLDYYHSADIFVFPSKKDVFGLVTLEALACGLPIVAFNTTGPAEVVPLGCGVSVLADADNDATLAISAYQAWCNLQNKVITPEMCRAYAERFTWENATNILVDNLHEITPLSLQSAQSSKPTESCNCFSRCLRRK